MKFAAVLLIALVAAAQAGSTHKDLLATQKVSSGVTSVLTCGLKYLSEIVSESKTFVATLTEAKEVVTGVISEIESCSSESSAIVCIAEVCMTAWSQNATVIEDVVAEGVEVAQLVEEFISCVSD